jgi:hypothetical protein
VFVVKLAVAHMQAAQLEQRRAIGFRKMKPHGVGIDNLQPSTLSGSFLLVFVTANDESAAVIADPQKLTISKMTRY